MAILLAGSLLAAACDAGDNTPGYALTKKTSLDAVLGAPANVTGVSIDPDTGAVLVVDVTKGVHRLEVDGTSTQLWNGDAMAHGIMLRSEFTDLAVLPGNQIALTARSFGYLLDLDAMTFRQHFCYVPGFEEEPWIWEEEDQITDSLTYNPATGQLMAQPETFDTNSAVSLRSEVATFDLDSGEDLEWISTGLGALRSGGMVALDAETVLLGDGSKLYRWSQASGLRNEADLASHGVSQIEGMALDASTGTLYVVDGATRQLFEFATR